MFGDFRAKEHAHSALEIIFARYLRTEAKDLKRRPRSSEHAPTELDVRTRNDLQLLDEFGALRTKPTERQLKNEVVNHSLVWVRRIR
jgi:hypothetical protein